MLDNTYAVPPRLAMLQLRGSHLSMVSFHITAFYIGVDIEMPPVFETL